MDFSEVLSKRHSIRKFKDKPVNDKTINEILLNLRTAPSAGNLQSYEVVIITDKTKKEALRLASHDQTCISLAPVIIAFLANVNKSTNKYAERGELYSVQDATIACTYAQLAVTNLGLTSVWVGAFNEDKVKLVLKTSLKPIALLPIGYPDEKSIITPRRDLNEFVSYE